MLGSIKIVRWTVFTLLVAGIATAAVLLFTTDQGAAIRDDPKLVAHRMRGWTDAHPVVAPIAFIATYITLILLLFPVWWMQILAGVCFGLTFGVVWSQVGATIGSAIAMMLSRFVAADWFRSKIESKMERLKKLDENMGHNGFLVVMAVRLMHFVPIGVSNYLFGLTTITLIDVVIGTAIGGIPTVSAYVGAGAGYHGWRFYSILAAINVVLLVPMILRYTRPEWFKKYGIE